MFLITALPSNNPVEATQPHATYPVVCDTTYLASGSAPAVVDDLTGDSAAGQVVGICLTAMPMLLHTRRS